MRQCIKVVHFTEAAEVYFGINTAILTGDLRTGKPLPPWRTIDNGKIVFYEDEILQWLDSPEGRRQMEIWEAEIHERSVFIETRREHMAMRKQTCPSYSRFVFGSQ